MLNDLLELTTTLVHPPHEPNISHIAGPNNTSSSAMAPRARHAKTNSVVSNAADVVNGILPGSSSPSSKPAGKDTGTAPRRRRRSHSTSTPGSPVVVVPVPSSRSDPSTTSRAVGTRRSGFSLYSWGATVLLSFFLEGVLQTATSFVGVGDLAAISEREDSWLGILGLLSFKFARLALYWAAGFDGTINHLLFPPLCD
jgi:hypothetical protein